MKRLRESGAITESLLVELFRVPRMAKLAEALGGEIGGLVPKKRKSRVPASGSTKASSGSSRKLR